LETFGSFIDVDEEGETVIITAIGQKVHDRLRIGDEEIEL
jgi:hypothetical protein